MKIHEIKKNKTIPILATVACLLIFSAAFFVLRDDSDPSPQLTDRATKEQIDAGELIKERALKENAQSGSDQPPSPVEQSSGKSKTDLMISAVNQTDTQLQIRTIISTVTSTGKCVLALTKGNESIIKESTVQATSNTSTCMGFNIPIEELSAGEWQLHVHFENDELLGSTTRKVDIR